MTSIPVYCVRCNGDNKEFIDFKDAYDYVMSATNRGIYPVDVWTTYPEPTLTEMDEGEAG